MTLCEQINCPYWCPSSSRSYGCQLFSVADQCYGSNLEGVSSNQYALSAGVMPTNFQAIVEEGIRGNASYKRDLKAQQNGLGNKYPLRKL